MEFQRIQRLNNVTSDEKSVDPLLTPGYSGLSIKQIQAFQGIFQLDDMSKAAYERLRPQNSFAVAMMNFTTQFYKEPGRQYKTVMALRPSDYTQDMCEKAGYSYYANDEFIGAGIEILAPVSRMEEAATLLDYMAAGKDLGESQLVHTVWTTDLSKTEPGRTGGWFAMDIPALYFYNEQMCKDFKGLLGDIKIKSILEAS